VDAASGHPLSGSGVPASAGVVCASHLHAPVMRVRRGSHGSAYSHEHVRDALAAIRDRDRHRHRQRGRQRQKREGGGEGGREREIGCARGYGYG